VASGERLSVDLDGVMFGYPASFLEEAFGGLARIDGIQTVLDNIVFQSRDEPLVIREIQSYIRDAEKTSKQRAAG
jgi:hypothetical protein